MVQKNQKKKKPQSLINRIKAFSKTDRAIQLLCIGIAFIFWLVTKLSYIYDTSVQVEVFYDIPDGKILRNPPPSQLNVEIQGTGWDLMGIHFSSENPSMNINVSEENILAPITLENRVKRLLPNTQLMGLQPNSVQLALEEEASKTIPIYFNHQIHLAPLHDFVDTPYISPARITIKGPASEIQNINKWETVPFIVNDVKNSIEKELDLLPHSNTNITFSPNKVNCKVTVEEVTEKKITVPIQIRNAPDSLLLTILPKKVEVACVVGLSHYDELDAQDFELFVDFNQADNSSALRVRIDKSPDFVRKTNLAPRKVDYIIYSKRSEENTDNE